MKILLIGECSNVHWTLAEGLRKLGHKVTVLSDGNGWRNYPRDISLTRKYFKLGGIIYIIRLYVIMIRLRGYDVVQIKNPIFIDIKAKRIFKVYNYLRKHNKKVFLGGYGDDWYWVYTCCNEKPLRYSDFNIEGLLRTNIDALIQRKEWIGTDKEALNRYVAKDCDGIITCLYEYWCCYKLHIPNKTHFIPLPIKMNEYAKDKNTLRNNSKIKFFIGIDKDRNEYKGTDIMLSALESIKMKYSEKIDIVKAVSIPFTEYERLMNGCDILLDQLYSYTPSMNALLAMSKGLVVVGGGESENYEIISETELRPIINVLPNYNSVYDELEKLVLHPERIPKLKRQSIEYIRKHHDYIKVARQYEKLYLNTLNE
ncbi:MAG: glycosyltransferase family 1 protein [Prevotella sp.]|nr:glycosyltransferase family 1 protein [Prevotella sp.]